MSKKNFANRPSQSAQEYVTTQDGRTVKNIAYLPTSQQLSELIDPTLPNKTLASEPESVYEYKHHSWRKVRLNDNDEYHRDGDINPRCSMRMEPRCGIRMARNIATTVQRLSRMMEHRNGTRTIRSTVRTAQRLSKRMATVNGG